MSKKGARCPTAPFSIAQRRGELWNWKDNSCYQGKLKLDSMNGGSRHPASILPQGNMSGGIDLLGCYGSPRIPGSSPDGGRHPVSILSVSFDRELLCGACATAAKEPGLAHNTQKNVHALAFLIRSYSNEGELVLDPMMGSGSTGVAALRCGRKFIGIEKEQRFFDLACERLTIALKRGADLMIDPEGYEANSPTSDKARIISRPNLLEQV